MKTAIVLAGHGSHISAETAGVVWAQVDALRAMQAADEVTAAFWKEQPSFHTVFDSLTAQEIIVVPMFTAQGYFTQTVIPAEMGLTGAVTQRDRRVIRYTRTLSEHPYLGHVVCQRVEEGLRQLNTAPERTAVAIIGHSTRRNPESRKATEAQAEAIRQNGLAAEVVALYLDDSPAVADVYRLTTAPNLIVVPYFLASGSHTSIDVPRELGLAKAAFDTVTPINGRAVCYTRPVGVEAELQTAILELITDTSQSLVLETPPQPPTASSWDGFPSAGLDEVRRRMTSTPFIFGQLRITAGDVRHVDDADDGEVIASPDALRKRVRENPFRPLATRSDLPRGWRVLTNSDPYRVLTVIETVYPGVLGSHIAASGTLEDAMNRQTGRYRALQSLGESASAQVVEQVCGQCIRQPAWAGASGGIHCPEPCDFWLSAALKQMKDDGRE
ncbi:MAG: hypothetical protein IT321_12735 [Anaerolineae bacterium]|nr:hypothetical protein [Anaerolineae bacterium]